MRLFAIHFSGSVNIFKTDSIHNAYQMGTKSVGVNLVSEITREDQIPFSLLNSATKQLVVIDFEESKNESLQICFQKDSKVDRSVLVELLNRHNPSVWFNFDNGKNGKWLVQTSIRTIKTPFGIELYDYLESI